MGDRIVLGGRYALVRHVGVGGAGDVYLVDDVQLGVQRALKLLFEPFATAERGGGDDTVRRRFLAEARLLLRLDHPNVVPVWDVGTYERRVFFVMDFAEGGTLRDRMEDGLPTRSVLDVARQVLAGLEYVHGQGIVHRDVKPDNVLRFDPDRWCLGDFGVARFRDPHRDDLTRTGDHLGTLGYMAPEQRMDPRWARPSSDLYGVGATLFALLCGATRPPADLYAMALTPDEHPGIPPALLDVVRSATRMDPRERYESAAAMREALEGAAAKLRADAP